MGDQHDRHLAIASQPVQAGEQIEPLLIGLNVAPTIADAFDRSPIINSASRIPDLRLNYIEAIDHDGLKIMRFVTESSDRRDNVVIFREHSESYNLKTRRAAVLGLQKDRAWELCSERGFAAALLAVNNDPWRQDCGGGVDVIERYHEFTSRRLDELCGAGMKESPLRRIASVG
jgi:hypothetical protein